MGSVATSRCPECYGVRRAAVNRPSVPRSTVVEPAVTVEAAIRPPTQERQDHAFEEAGAVLADDPDALAVGADVGGQSHHRHGWRGVIRTGCRSSPLRSTPQH